MTGDELDHAIGAAADFHDIVAAIDQAPRLAPDLAVLALGKVLVGVVTGEGPTTRGRVHFSRTIDATDALLCEMILIAGGGAAERPVTREEAEILFHIYEAGRDREDDGHFDGLLVKAIAHHVLAAGGHVVPPRAVALDRNTAIAQWAARSCATIDRDVAAWLDAQVRRNRRAGAPLDAIAALLTGAGAVPVASSRTPLRDFAA